MPFENSLKKSIFRKSPFDYKASIDKFSKISLHIVQPLLDPRGEYEMSNNFALQNLKSIHQTIILQ